MGIDFSAGKGTRVYHVLTCKGTLNGPTPTGLLDVAIFQSDFVDYEGVTMAIVRRFPPGWKVSVPPAESGDVPRIIDPKPKGKSYTVKDEIPKALDCLLEEAQEHELMLLVYSCAKDRFLFRPSNLDCKPEPYFDRKEATRNLELQLRPCLRPTCIQERGRRAQSARDLALGRGQPPAKRSKPFPRAKTAPAKVSEDPAPGTESPHVTRRRLASRRKLRHLLDVNYKH